MIRLIQRRLIIPRGDTGTFSIPVLTSSNMGDVSIFTIFNPLTHKKIAEKRMELSDGVLTVTFSHGDTVNLPAGQYVWDIKFYRNPVFAGEQLIDGEEIDSYYAAFSLPVCEIRETGDSLLMDDDTPQAKLAPDQIDLISAAITATQTAKEAAVNSAADAEASASAAATSAQAASDSKDAALASQTSAATSESNAAESAAAAQESATRAAQIAQQIHEEIPTKVSDLVDDSGHYIKPETGIPASDLEETYLTSFTEEDPTVPEWAKQPQKPTYTPQEVGALPADTFIPSKVSDLTDDSGHYTKPANGIPASDLEETYLTEHQDLSNYVQKTDYATNSTAGIIRVGSGLYSQGNAIHINAAPERIIKMGTTDTAPIVASNQHASTFYGLAKAAGDTTQSQSSNAVGTYTDEAKAAIQQMLGVPSTADIPTNVSELTNDAGYLTEHQDISGKANSADLAAVATSGSYEDLSDKPTIPEVPVQDVQINGSSILENGVASIPIATIPNQYGLMKVPEGRGIGIGGAGSIQLLTASSANIKSGTEVYKPIVPKRQQEAVFYGLSKAAGADLANEENITVGTYPDSAKTAIQQMLGVPSTSAVTSEIAAAIGNINSFDMAVVQELPTQDISTHTIYLVPKTGETNDVYDEYVYINNAWEMVGNTQVDLSNYALKSELPTKVSDLTNDAGYLTTHQDISGKANTADLATVATSGSYNDLSNKPTIPEVPVQDVQANGTSILNNGIANIPVATKYDNATNPSRLGLVNIGQGLNISAGGMLTTSYASTSEIKGETSYYSVITPKNVNVGVFYGLAKAAGDTTQSQSNNSVGSYTNTAKGAIQKMLGISDLIAPEENDLVADQAYSIGDIFTCGGKLYKATSAIAFGGTIVPTTNCVETTVIDAVATKLDATEAGLKVVRLI